MKLAWPSKKAGTAALFAALAVASVSPNAAAQEPSKADLDKARTLFQEGVALAAANNCAAALMKYKAVAQVKMTAQVAFNTAECEERLGKLVSALGNYRVAASQAQNDKRAAGVLKEVPGRIDSLEARIPKLTITRTKGGETATIELDGTEIGTGQLGQALPVDPGAHVVVAKVGGKEWVHDTVNVAEKDNKTYEVKLNVPPPKIEQPKEETPKEETPPPPPPKSRVPGAVVTAVGGAVMIAGFAFLAPRGAAISELEGKCQMTGANAGHCLKSAEDIANRGKLFTGLTEVFVPVGLATTIAGIVMIAKAGPQAPASDSGEKKDAEKKEVTWQFVPSAPSANVGGVSIVGRF
jgi:hypothetical protein